MGKKKPRKLPISGASVCYIKVYLDFKSKFDIVLISPNYAKQTSVLSSCSTTELQSLEALPKNDIKDTFSLFYRISTKP